MSISKNEYIKQLSVSFKINKWTSGLQHKRRQTTSMQYRPWVVQDRPRTHSDGGREIAIVNAYGRPSSSGPTTIWLHTKEPADDGPYCCTCSFHLHKASECPIDPGQIWGKFIKARTTNHSERVAKVPALNGKPIHHREASNHLKTSIIQPSRGPLQHRTPL